MAPPHARWQDVLINLATEWLKQRLDFYVHYVSRVQKLDNDVTSLQDARDRVQRKVDEEETRYGKQIDVFVQHWLEDVNKIIPEYEKFNNDEDSEYAVFSGGFLPRWGIRRRLSIDAEGIAKKVTELLQKAPSHDKFSHWHGPPSIDGFLLNIDYVSFDSREKTKNDIMKALEHSSVRIIGVHGWSGVGKTTLVKQVAKKAREDKLFNIVIMANVTRNPDIIKIQGQIAEILGVELEEKSDIARAARVRKGLENEKQKTLIILDDLWAKLDFNMLGIPFANDDNDGKSLEAFSTTKAEKDGSRKTKAQKPPSAYNDTKTPGAYNETKTKETPSAYRGCKVLLISETKQVLMSQMDGKEESIFSVEILKEKEAEMLFKKMAGIDDNSEFKKLAAQIANKCEGLPISIVTTARALKNQRPLVWEDVHRKLERQKLTGAPEFSTMLSYDLLENEELKYVFLLCARMGRDALFMDLVRYCIGLGFLEGIYTVWEARDRVHVLVEKLKESGLLSDSHLSDRFTMPDIVHRAALSIASKEIHAFTMTKGKLDEWPDVDKLERYAVISLQHCDILEEFPQSINCPRLRVFHLDSNDSNLKIPDNFFEGMKELRVLILSGIHLSPLPSSIRCLTKLRMLCLERCTLGEQLCIIGELKKLRVLSLSGSGIEQLPDDLKQLTKLQIFDISNCSQLKNIPSGVISSLICLEELYMRDTSIQWKDEGRTNQSDNASLSELRHLDQLTTIDIQIPNISHLPKNLFFDKLHSYKIVIGDLNAYLETGFMMPEKYEASRFLALHLKDDFHIHSQMGIKMLFERVEHLLLEDLSGVEHMFYELNLKGFLHLKSLIIVSNSDIQSLIKPKDRDKDHLEKAFPKLESLYLYNLKNMKEICSCTLSAPSSFGKLKLIKIKLCAEMKNLFLISVARLLTVLEEIDVSECNSLEEIVQSNVNEVEDLELPQLRYLRLQSLSKFIGFSISSGETGELFYEKVVVSKLEIMELSSIPINRIWSDQPSQSPYFQNLMHLDVNGCGNLKYLLSFSMAKCLVKLESLSVCECEKMEHIFPQRQDSDAKMKGSFPNLKNIKLSSMKSLTEIWNAVPLDSFCKLDTLIIEKCDKLVNVFPRYMVEIFQSLCILWVIDCESMKVIFDLNDQKRDARDVMNLQVVRLEALPKLEHVWKLNKDKQRILNLKNLQLISVEDCKSLENIFPVSVVKFLENLECLGVQNCFELREIVAKGEVTSSPDPLVFPQLTAIYFSVLPKLGSFYGGILDCPVLNYLSVLVCDKLELFREATGNAPSNEAKRFLFPEKNFFEGMDELSVSDYLELQQAWDGKVGLQNNWFYSLETLKLENCEIQPYAIPSHVLPYLKSLKELEVRDCHKVEGMFDMNEELTLQLKKLTLGGLRDLKNVWEKNCQGILSFQNLQQVVVSECHNLETLFPEAIAKNLKKLEELKIVNCVKLKGIVGKEDEAAAAAAEGTAMFEFPRLTSLHIEFLPELTYFYPGRCLECPVLNSLFMLRCDRLEVFRSQQEVHQGSASNSINKQPVFSDLKAISNLDQWLLDWKEISKFRSGQFTEDLQCLNCLYLLFDKNEKSSLPVTILAKAPKLETMVIDCCRSLEIFTTNHEGKDRMLRHLKVLFLRAAVELQPIGSEDSSWLNTICDQLHELHVYSCYCSTTLVSSAVSFSHLKKLQVANCVGLKYLFTSSTAKTFAYLEEMYVKGCESMKEIVKEEDETTSEGIEFERLDNIALESLSNLECFYSGNATLKLPSLIEVVIQECPKMEIFSRGSIHAESFKGILASLHSNEEVFFFHHDLNATVKRQFFLHRNHLILGDYDELEEIWLRAVPVPDGSFSNLKSLVVEGCEFLSKAGVAIPSYILPFLRKLEELKVQKCNSIEAVFDVKDTPTHHTKMGLASPLQLRFKKLILENLPNLKHVWSEDPQGSISLPFLEEVLVFECKSIKSLFPASVAKGILVKTLDVKNCDGLVEIVAKDEGATKGAIEKHFIFPMLSSLTLSRLPNLKCFYPGMHNREWPTLTILDVDGCQNLKVFVTNFQNCPESHREGQDCLPTDRQALVSAEKVTPHLEGLTLNKEDVVMIEQRQLHVDLQKLKFLVLASFIDKSDVFPYVFLSEEPLPSIEALGVRGSNFEEIFPSERPAIDYTKILSQLKGLVLNDLPMLNSIGLEHSWMAPFPQTLEALFVYKCNCLTNLVPSTVSFSHLTELKVEDCHGLEYLFTSSTAKSLGALEKMEITNCESLRKIVEDKPEDDETEEDEILFGELKILSLSTLPGLGSFYTGSSALKFPSLEEVSFTRCHNMKMFCRGDLAVPQNLKGEIDGCSWSGDINNAIKRQFGEGSSLS